MALSMGLLGASLAGPAGAYELIESQVLSSSASSVTFSSIPQDYKHLQLRITSRDDFGSAAVDSLVRFNNDSNTNYAFHYLFGWNLNSSVLSGGQTSTDSIKGFWSAGNSRTDVFGASVMDIYDYANSSKATTLRTLTGSAGDRIGIYSGLWTSTSAVTSITLLSAGTYFFAGSRFSLYGIRG